MDIFDGPPMHNITHGKLRNFAGLGSRNIISAEDYCRHMFVGGVRAIFCLNPFYKFITQFSPFTQLHKQDDPPRGPGN